MKHTFLAAVVALSVFSTPIIVQAAQKGELTTTKEIGGALVGKWLERAGEMWEFSAAGEVTLTMPGSAKLEKGTYTVTDGPRLVLNLNGKKMTYEVRAWVSEFKLRDEAGTVTGFWPYTHRTLARITLEELLLLDSAIDQWAIEFNKKEGELPTNENLRQYFKPGTRLHHVLGQPGAVKDLLGNSFGPFVVDTPPRLHPDTVKTLSDVATKEFWQQFSE